jgi:hypothetical protein
VARKPRLLKLKPVEKVQPTYGAKVTGHNLANITYLVSKAAERGGYEFEFKAKFWGDGSLDYVEVPGPFNKSNGLRNYRVGAGGWLFLAPGESHLTWGDYHPVQSGLFEELG